MDYSTIRLACAQAAHEVNRRYCAALGDDSQLAWEMAPQWQRASALEGVDGVLLYGDTPEKSHEHWMACKVRDGWKYGPVKDAVKLEHPCMVPYEQLPLDQRKKDTLFVRTVTEMCAALGLTIGRAGGSQ